METAWNTLAEKAHETDLWGRVASFERLGASVEELARETMESILGFEGKGGHKPARADIQKMKDVHDLFWRQTAGADGEPRDYGARKEWEERFGLTDKEKGLIGAYNILCREYGAEGAFKSLSRIIMEQTPSDSHGRILPNAPVDISTAEVAITPEAKKATGALLKKNEEQHYGQLYQGIRDALADLARINNNSYKLWPWAVKQMKADFNGQLGTGVLSEPGRGAIRFSHIVDIVSEGGGILDQLRRDNRVPQNFDVNKLDFKEFEQWLMQWKRDNREANSQGDVVYKFHDGWTIQKLTTEDQLQYEGDEMGHCVGGYSHQVGEGQTIIYSLRDPKGNPHVTMEIEALEGPLNLNPGEEVPEDASYNHEYIHPDKHDPGEHLEEVDNTTNDNSDRYKPSGERAFDIVQVQGNSNLTPKPEYQRKIKEFLDSLRAKGWKFERSPNWYANYDDGEHDENEEWHSDTIKNATQLDDWYTRYQSAPQKFQVGGEDSYGLNRERSTVPVSDWGEVITECLASLTDDYDRDRWKTTNWQSLAQQVYHGWMLDTSRTHQSKGQLERAKSDLEASLEKAGEKLDEWTGNQYHYVDSSDDILKKFEELAEEQGVEVEEYDDVDEAEAAHPDLYQEASDQVRWAQEGEYAGNAHSFLGYLHNLLYHNGAVNPGDLPDPNQTHGGLPSYDDLMQKNLDQQNGIGEGAEEQNDHPLNLPGAMSAWQPRSMAERTGDPELDKLIDQFLTEEHDYIDMYRNSEDADGHCDEVSEFFAGWLSRHGMKATLSGGQTIHDEEGLQQWTTPDALGYEDRPGIPNANGEVDKGHADHYTTTVHMPSGLYSIDWTASQYGYTEFPLVQKLDDSGGWQREFTSAEQYRIVPIDHDNNVWLDTDGNQRERYRPGWAKNPTTGKMEQTGELEDTFLDKHGRQGEGVVAYHGDDPVGSLTWVNDRGWHMLGTTYVHPDHREKGLFNQMAAPLRETGKPIDAYVWDNPWLKKKVRSWS